MSPKEKSFEEGKLLLNSFHAFIVDARRFSWNYHVGWLEDDAANVAIIYRPLWSVCGDCYAAR